MKRLTALLIVLCAMATEANAYIGLCCGKCGGNMPMNIPGGGVPETHEFRFKVQPMIMRMDGLRRGTQNVDGSALLGMPVMMGMPTGKYMAVPTSMDMTMVNLVGGYSFTDDFFAGLMAMYQSNRMDMRFNSMMAATTGAAGYTMKSDGMTDTMLMAKYRLYADDPMIPSREASLFLGLSIPTGSIDRRNSTHPMAMRRKELLPYGMQLGSGTWDPSIGMLYQRSTSPWWWGVDARYTWRVGTNKRGYRLGNRAQLDAYLMYQPSVSTVVYGELNGDWLQRMHGEADEARVGLSGRSVAGDPTSPYMTPSWDPANSGKTQAFVTLGLQWQPAPLHILDLGVQLPVYQRMNGVQLKDKWRVVATWYVEVPTSRSVRALGTDAIHDEDLGF